MAKGKILVVDDEEDLLKLLNYNLKNEGYHVDCATSGEEALEKSRGVLPDLIILDLMLPGIDGLDLCRILKNDYKTTRIPIIMLTAKGEEADIVAGLEIGADDYITKPFSPRVLLARVKVVLRRGRESEKAKIFSHHGISLDTNTRNVRVDNEAVELTSTEFDILLLFLRKPGWVFTRNQIIDLVKGHDYPVTDRSIDVQIVNLRKKLGQSGKYIETVRGVGYRIRE